MKRVIVIGNWALFGISVAIFMATVYNAVLGRQLDLTAQIKGITPGALIVAGIVTTSWLLNGLACKLRVVESGWEWWGTALLAITAFVIDILIMAALVFNYVIPSHLPLIVVMGHAGMHFILWIATSYEREKQEDGLLGGSYETPEARLLALELELRDSMATIRTLEGTIKAQERALEGHKRTLDEATKKHSVTCEHCGWTKVYDTQASADQGLATHQAQWCKGPKAEATSNGHKHEAVPT